MTDAAAQPPLSHPAQAAPPPLREEAGRPAPHPDADLNLGPDADLNLDPGPGPAGAPAARAAGRRARAILLLEFLALYLGVPAAMAFALPPSAMWPVMFAATGLSFLLLRRESGFAWRSALGVPDRAGWIWTVAIGAVCLLLGGAVVAVTAPEALFVLPLEATGLWAMIMLFYPPLSALPQEIIFRTLFFARHARLFPSPAMAIAANGAVFGLAHAFLGNWIAVVLSGLGGAVFALAYLRAGPRRGLLTVTAMHAAAGCALFTAGMGVFLYHGFAGG